MESSLFSGSSVPYAVILWGRKLLWGQAAFSPHVRTWLSSITEKCSSPHIPKTTTFFIPATLWNSFMDNMQIKRKEGGLSVQLCGRLEFTILDPILFWRAGTLRTLEGTCTSDSFPLDLSMHSCGRLWPFCWAWGGSWVLPNSRHRRNPDWGQLFRLGVFTFKSLVLSDSDLGKGADYKVSKLRQTR